MRHMLTIGLAILLSSCATTTANYYDKTVQSWNGGNAKTLVQRWGAPDRSLMAQNGHILYIYQSQSYRNFNATNAPAIGVNVSSQGRAVVTTMPNTNTAWNRGAMSISCTTTFEIDKNGTILNANDQGPSCYGNENFAKNKSNPKSPVMN